MTKKRNALGKYVTNDTYIPDHAEWCTDREEDNVCLFAPFEYGDYHTDDVGDTYVSLEDYAD